MAAIQGRFLEFQKQTRTVNCILRASIIWFPVSQGAPMNTYLLALDVRYSRLITQAPSHNRLVDGSSHGRRSYLILQAFISSLDFTHFVNRRRRLEALLPQATPLAIVTLILILPKCFIG